MLKIKEYDDDMDFLLEEDKEEVYVKVGAILEAHIRHTEIAAQHGIDALRKTCADITALIKKEHPALVYNVYADLMRTPYTRGPECVLIAEKE